MALSDVVRAAAAEVEDCRRVEVLVWSTGQWPTKAGAAVSEWSPPTLYAPSAAALEIGL